MHPALMARKMIGVRCAGSTNKPRFVMKCSALPNWIPEARDWRAWTAGEDVHSRIAWDDIAFRIGIGCTRRSDCVTLCGMV